MAQVFYRKRFSSYLGEQRAIDDIITSFVPDGPLPSPTPSPTSITPTPTPTPSITPTITPTSSVTPTITPTNTSTPTPSITPTNTKTPTPTPTRTPAPACDITYTELPSPTPSPTPTITPTNTSSPTPTPTASPGPSFDPDAAAYLASVVSVGGVVTSPMSAATNNMFLALKSNGLYSKMKAFYPVLGGTAASQAINGNLNTSFDLTFNNGFTHSYSGFVGTTLTSYAETNYVPITQHSGNTMSMGMFTNFVDLINTSGDFYMMGAYTAQDRFLSWDYYNVGLPNVFFTGKYLDNNLTSNLQVSAVTNWIGMVQLGGDNTNKYITQNRNGVDYIASAAQDGTTLPNQSIYLSNLNVLGGPYKNQGSRVAFAYMGDYLTTGETTTLSSIINAFQTSLGRNTY